METAQHSRLPAMFRAAAAVAPVAMLVADSRGKLLAANQRWIDLAGPAEVTVRPETWTGVFEPESRIRMVQYMEDVASGIVTPESLDLEMITRAGRRWTRWWVRREEVEEYVLLTIVVVDVHDDVAQKQDLRELATHDHLTGLLNRRFFMETVNQALRRAERSGSTLGLLYIDLDGFKEVNDEAGHIVGDRVLSAVGARLRMAVRSADVAARLGGDEFAVLLETVHGRGDIVARRVEEALNGPVDVDGRLWPIAASVGLALVDDPHEPGESLLHRADAAMYEAKRARRRGAASGVAIAQPAAPIPPPPPADEPYPPADPYQLPVEEAAPRANGLIDKEALVHLDTLRGEIARVRESLQAIGKHLQIDYE